MPEVKFKKKFWQQICHRSQMWYSFFLMLLCCCCCCCCVLLNLSLEISSKLKCNFQAGTPDLIHFPAPPMVTHKLQCVCVSRVDPQGGGGLRTWRTMMTTTVVSQPASTQLRVMTVEIAAGSIPERTYFTQNSSIWSVEEPPLFPLPLLYYANSQHLYAPYLGL